MIGPPGLPKFGRRIFRFARPASRLRRRPSTWKWVIGLYLAGVLAHVSHHLAFEMPKGSNPTLGAALTEAPVSFAWPADLIGTLIQLS